MPVTAREADDGKTLVLEIEGRFDFRLHDAFRAAYQRTKAQHVVVDLARADGLDSSALGLLVLLREHVAEHDASVAIVHCSPEIRVRLASACFDRLFCLA
jgi:HptB-dependent secretion and biofilm anti anti-sigma factor